MTTSPITTTAPAPAPTAVTSSLNSLSDPNTFLKLLVAQLANQDPEQPADGTTFVTQLATFAGVQQQSQIRTDLDAINAVAQKYAAGPNATGTQATGSSN